MGIRIYAAGTLAIIGGLLMVGSGYNSRGFLYQALGYAEPHVSDFLNGAAASVAVIAITIIEVLIALGGLTVLIGGLIILARHTTGGRVLIYLGGGAGFLGLLISFGYSMYKLQGLDPVLAYLPYWVGLTMAIVGRKVAKGA
ncbi:MAG: hypothetical protein KGI38_00050 [Thaumarchaeota archaeon]|nr:hypothetical protein [Nitrososphaerota archaeon]